MKISLILPVYNVEAYLGKCIESCLNQDLPQSEYEIIIVIDGSPDKSIEVARRYQEKNANIRIVERENGGLSAARNTGLKVAKGEYVWFIDSDDYITNNCIGSICNEMTQQGLNALWFRWKNKNDFHKDIPLYDCTICKEDYQIYNGIEFMNTIMGIYYFAWSFIYNRNFLLNNKFLFQEGLFYEDTEFAFRVLPYIERIKLYNNVCYTYNIRQGSITQTISTKKIDDLIKIVELAKIKNEEYPQIISFKRSASNIIVNVILYSLSINYYEGIKKAKFLLNIMFRNAMYIVGSKANRSIILSYNWGGFYCMMQMAIVVNSIKKCRNMIRGVLRLLIFRSKA